MGFHLLSGPVAEGGGVIFRHKGFLHHVDDRQMGDFAEKAFLIPDGGHYDRTIRQLGNLKGAGVEGE